MLPWSHALLLTTLAALGGVIAAWWTQQDRADDLDGDHPLWLLAPTMTTLVGAAGVSLALHLRPAGAAGLSMVYADNLLPATLCIALVAGLTATAATGWTSRICFLLTLSALLAAVVTRLDARILHFVIDSNNAAVRGWFIERLIPVWPWRIHLLQAAGGALLIAALPPLLRRRPLGGFLLTSVVVAVALTAAGLSAGWAEVVDPDARARLAHARVPIIEAPGPLARPSGADLTISESGAHLSALTLIPPLRILVALPGTETLPESLRWTGWREIAIDSPDDPDAIRLFGAAGQVWLSREGDSVACGSLSDAPRRLSAQAITGSVTIQPDTDWTLGDLAALCVSVGGDCALSGERGQPALF
ncbi:MAG: hypothetical protein P8R54_31750 [Myxococcota bacterium]|nr:hypothetical protein [Myxococcota bacterium]